MALETVGKDYNKYCDIDINGKVVTDFFKMKRTLTCIVFSFNL